MSKRERVSIDHEPYGVIETGVEPMKKPNGPYYRCGGRHHTPRTFAQRFRAAMNLRWIYGRWQCYNCANWDVIKSMFGEKDKYPFDDVDTSTQSFQPQWHEAKTLEEYLVETA